VLSDETPHLEFRHRTRALLAGAQGFGFDFAVVLDPDAAKRQVGKGSYWWWGIAGTWFWIDPTTTWSRSASSSGAAASPVLPITKTFRAE
jgi:CubicO group peptidase (beta-lactamase class C family)